MNKRGDLTATEVVKIVIGILALAILIILAYYLYTMFIFNAKQEQAQVAVEKIKGGIDLLKGDSSRTDVSVLIYNPKTWVLKKSATGLLCCCPPDFLDDNSCIQKGTCINAGTNLEVGNLIPGGYYKSNAGVNFYVYSEGTESIVVGSGGKVPMDLKIFRQGDMILVRNVNAVASPIPDFIESKYLKENILNFRLGQNSIKDLAIKLISLYGTNSQSTQDFDTTISELKSSLKNYFNVEYLRLSIYQGYPTLNGKLWRYDTTPMNLQYSKELGFTEKLVVPGGDLATFNIRIFIPEQMSQGVSGGAH